MREYNPKIDFGKMIAAAFVVFIHIPFPGLWGEYINSIANYAVCFFFVSAGYFTKYDYNIIRKKILLREKKIICIFLFSIILYMLLSIFNGNFTDKVASFFSLNSVLKFFLFNDVTVKYHLWFLPALGYVYLVIFFLSKYVMVKWRNYIMLSLFLLNPVLTEVFWELLRVDIANIYTRNFMLVGIPFFLLGIYMNEMKEKLQTRNNIKKYVLLVFVGLVFAYFEMYTLHTSVTVSSVLIAFGMFGLCIVNSKNNGTSKRLFIVEEWGTIALLVYVLHPMVIDWLYSLGELSEAYLLLRPVLCYVLSVLLAVGVSMLALHISRVRAEGR